VRLSVKARNLPGRITTGAYIFHAGLEKWSADEDRAAAVHGMASGSYPLLKDVPPPIFIKLLAASELATGALLLSPFVSNFAAGAALTGFSGGLLGMYLRTEALRKPGSIWPSQAGIGISKDVWMLGIGVGLLADSITGGGRNGRKKKRS
jgi:uncharacterized membrane protein YphA (DoxX/SURF4 family)